MSYGKYSNDICEVCGLNKEIMTENCEVCEELSVKNKRIQKYTIALCGISTFGFFIKIVFL